MLLMCQNSLNSLINESNEGEAEGQEGILSHCLVLVTCFGDCICVRRRNTPSIVS